jgi:hypothetical protein
MTKKHRHEDAKLGRNDPCSCGSGKKYKRCCLPKLLETRAAARAAEKEAADGHVHGPDCNHDH